MAGVRDRIGTVRTHAHELGVRALVAQVLRLRASMGVASGPMEPPPPDRVAPDVKVTAYVNHGRWVADCPDRLCGGAELVDPDEPMFFCLSCYNAHAGMAWIPVQFPDETERHAIETALLARERTQNRNWLPGESVDDLQEEHERRRQAEEERLGRALGLRRVVERHGAIVVERWDRVER